MKISCIIALLNRRYGCTDDIGTLEKIKSWVKTRIPVYPELLMLNMEQKLLESRDFDVVALIESLAKLLSSRSISAVPMAKYNFCYALVGYLERSYASTVSRAPVSGASTTTLLYLSPVMMGMNYVMGSFNTDYQTRPLESFLELFVEDDVLVTLLQDDIVQATESFFARYSVKDKKQKAYIFKLLLSRDLHEDPIVLIQFVEKFFVLNSTSRVLGGHTKIYDFQACRAWFDQLYVTSYTLSLAIDYLASSPEQAQILYVVHYISAFLKVELSELQTLKPSFQNGNFKVFLMLLEMRTGLKILNPDEGIVDIHSLFQSLYRFIGIIVHNLDPKEGEEFLCVIHDKVTKEVYGVLEERFKSYLESLVHSGTMETQSFVHEGVASSLGGPPADMLMAAELARQMSCFPVVFPITFIEVGSENQEFATSNYHVMFRTPQGIPFTLFVRFFGISRKMAASVEQVTLIHKLFPGFAKQPLYVYAAPNGEYRLFFKPVFQTTETIGIKKWFEQMITMMQVELLERACYTLACLSYEPYQLDLDLVFVVLAEQLGMQTMKEESKASLRKKIATVAASVGSLLLRDIAQITIRKELQVVLERCDVWDGSPYGTLSHLIDVDFSRLTSMQLYTVLQVLSGIGRVCYVVSPHMLPYLSSRLHLRATEQVVNVFFDTDVQLVRVFYNPAEISVRFHIFNRKGEKVFLHQSNMKGWDVGNVLDDGNCFYRAVVDQLQRRNLKAELLRETPEPHIVLRQRNQGASYKDKELVGKNDVIQFTTVFQDFAIAIMDISVPDRGYTVLFYQGRKVQSISRGVHVIRLAFAENHYMSVLANPELAQGYLTEEYNINTEVSNDHDGNLCGISYNDHGIQQSVAKTMAAFFEIPWVNDMPIVEREFGRAVIDSEAPGSQWYPDDVDVIYQDVQANTSSCVDNALFNARKAQSLGYKAYLLELNGHLVTLIHYPKSITLQDLLQKIDLADIPEDESQWKKYVEFMTGINYPMNIRNTRDIATTHTLVMLKNGEDAKLLAQYEYYLRTGEVLPTLEAGWSAGGVLMLTEIPVIELDVQNDTENDVLQQFYSTATRNNFLVDALEDMSHIEDVEEQIEFFRARILPYVIANDYDGDYARLIQILLRHYGLQPHHNTIDVSDAVNVSSQNVGFVLGSHMVGASELSLDLDLSSVI
jgi:hypothetical protein